MAAYKYVIQAKYNNNTETMAKQKQGPTTLGIDQVS